MADTPSRDDEASERRRRADLLAMLLGVSVDDTATGPAPSAPDPSTSEPSTFESAPPSPDPSTVDTAAAPTSTVFERSDESDNTAGGSPLFDPTVLATLNATIGTDLGPELATAFITGGAPLLDQFADGINGRDRDMATRAVHTLTSSAAYLGATRLAEQASSLEQRLIDGHRLDARHVRRLQSLYASTVDRLEHLLPDPDPGTDPGESG
ncbi:MAG: Hpt domain-containing protein [Actinomycetota bacterium]